MQASESEATPDEEVALDPQRYRWSGIPEDQFLLRDWGEALTAVFNRQTEDMHVLDLNAVSLLQQLSRKSEPLAFAELKSIMAAELAIDEQDPEYGALEHYLGQLILQLNQAGLLKPYS